MDFLRIAFASEHPLEYLFLSMNFPHKVQIRIELTVVSNMPQLMEFKIFDFSINSVG